MIIGIKEITSAINKIADLTSGDKIIPGVMLRLKSTDDDAVGVLDVCYSDGHKSLIEELSVDIEETDMIGDIVVAFEQISRAISNCQPSGIIKVDNIYINHVDNNVIRVSAEQYMNITDESGEVVAKRNLAVKKMDIAWVVPGSDMKSAILNRMKYDEIFTPDGDTDDYTKDEFVEALSKTSTEKGKSIYVSQSTQSVFVANQAHVTSVPISDNEGEKRISKSLVIPQNIAKAIIGILNKCSSDTISIHRSDRYCNIIVQGEEEKVGIWFEMAQASKAHIGALERFDSLEYKTYQILFLREFLVNSIKSALESSKNDKVEFKFETTELENSTCDKDLVITGSNVGASVVDTYRVNPDDIVDTVGNLADKKFSASLKVISDMLAQLKTDYIAFDINVDVNDTTCIRIAEVDANKLAAEYTKAREQTAKLCEEQGIEFNPSVTPTPVELKVGYRADILNTKQYTILAK